MNLLKNEDGLGILAIVGIMGALAVLAAGEKAPNPPPGLKEQVVELRMEVRDIQARYKETDKVKAVQAAPKRKTPAKPTKSLKKALIKANKELRKLENIHTEK